MSDQEHPPAKCGDQAGSRHKMLGSSTNAEQRRPAARQPSVDAIVVLGCAAPEGRASPALLRRVALGARLLQSGVAPLLLLSGGGSTTRPEAAAMREAALAHGIDEAAILTEAGSRNTYENAIETARLLHARGLASLILVSDAYHLPRARLLFRLVGLDIRGTAHPPRRSLWRETPLVLREVPALLLSLLRILRHRGPVGDPVLPPRT